MRNGQTLQHLVIALMLAASPLGVVACDSTVGGNGDDDDGGGGDAPDPQPESIDAVDVLLVVDGSGSMADKQGFLAESFRPFLERLRSPRCVDAAGQQVTPQPATQADACPEGSVREYTADVTVHVGVVSSSIGAGILCETTDRPFNDDQAHLLARGTGSTVIPSYQELGFFAWDPAQRLAPAGDADFDAFVASVETAIRGVGELGCGVEQPLEAMFRFLAEPDPRWRTADGSEGATDEVLLAQRAAFLRPASVLSVILLSDENDASLDPRYEWLAAAPQGQNMPRARAECAVDPGDPCCTTCILSVPAGCTGDGGCAAPGDQSNPDNFYPGDDPQSSALLRTWDAKRRFGVEWALPIDRYAQALSSATIVDADGAEHDNPVFAGGRQAEQVVYTAIVGVPWQDVARDPADIAAGFQSPSEMRDRGTWDVIVGDPGNYVPASDPLMIESPERRFGTTPTTGEPVDGPNRINGGDRETGWGDLQYACVFDLPAEDVRDCSAGQVSCDCNGDQVDNPLCAENDDGERTVQVRAKAYPGLRQLELARQLGDQGRVVPMCGLLLEPGDTVVPGTLGTLGISTGLNDVAEDVAGRLRP